MSIFDLAREYQAEKAVKQSGGYTTPTLIEDLKEIYVPIKRKSKKKTAGKGTQNIHSYDMGSYLREIRSHCAELFPSCQNINLREMEPTEKFQYLKFFYYIGKTYSEWRADGYNLFACLRTPSERHQQYYVKMLRKILDNKL